MEVLVGDYLTLQRGITYRGDLVGKPGPALLGLGAIQPGGGFRERGYKTYGGECPLKIMLFPGDLFASLKGATKDGEMIGSIARVPNSVSSGRLTQDTVKLVFNDKNKDTSGYLYWILRTPQYRDYCARHATGSAVVALSRDDFLNYPIPPITPIRKLIVTLLEKLEDKIDLNRRMNETLETMALALFKSWFVDFDPVIDNALAAGNGMPEPLQERAAARQALGDKRKPLPEDIRKLFPDSFVFDEELGWIPQGWTKQSLGEVSGCYDRLRVPLSKKQREEKKPGNIPYYGATSIMDYVNEWIFDDIFLLVGEDGSVIREDGFPFVQYIWGKAWVNNHAHVLKGKNDVSTEHLMLFMQQQNVTAYVTGAVQPKINQKNLNSIPFLNAHQKLNIEFTNRINSIYKKYRYNSEITNFLIALRDTLLPKLLSGELRIPDAEKLIEEAV